MASKGRILVIAGDASLAQEIGSSHMGAEFEVRQAPGARDAESFLASSNGTGAGLVLDLSHLPRPDCDRLLRAQGPKSPVPVFLLRPNVPVSPAVQAPMRTLYWPFPPGFAQQAAAAASPVVFLVERTLYMARAIELSFKDTGVQPVTLQSTKGLGEFLLQQPKPIEPAKPKSAWSKFMDVLTEKPAPVYVPGSSSPGLPRGLMGHVVAALIPGEAEARACDEEVRRLMPSAACYYVTNVDPLLAAAKALRDRAPVSLTREQAGLIAGMLSAAPTRSFAVENAPVILMDRDQERLAPLAQTLLAAGYHVEMAKDDNEVLKLVSAPGRFQAAVIGLSFAYSFTYAPEAGPNLAQRLKEIDPDLRFIFMVDLYPLERAVREMSRCIEVGGDDAFVKPVEAPRLLLSVERSLKRRRIMMAAVQARREAPSSRSSASGAGLVDGRYDLVFQIGEGGMGVVYLASDRQLGRKVALKKMRPEIKANPAHREKFLEEAKIISHLNHPYIVGIHEIIEDGGEIYIVLEYVDGKSLALILHERRRLPLKECADIFFQVCQGVDSAHRNHVLHRDLKPSNIMIDANGYAKVMDFGLARETKDTVTMLTQKDAGGTLAYMAPEQHLGRCGRASDVYALGVCLYEMLTGALPFKGPDFLAQKERMTLTPPSAAVPGLSPAVDALLEKALAPDPKDRIQDAVRLLESLRRIAA